MIYLIYEYVEGDNMDFANLLKNNLWKICVVFGIIIISIVVIILMMPSTASVSSKDSYIAIEKKLVQAAEKYFKNNPKRLPDINEEKKVELKTLIAAKIIKPIKNKNQKDSFCTGRVKVTQKENENYIYKPYLKCGKDYETTYLSKYIVDNSIVTEGDGLYELNDKYIYKGDRPNNYIKIGENLYRIISINEENEIRVINTTAAEELIYWDNRYNSESKKNDGINDFNKSRLKEFLSDYINNESLSKKLKNMIISKPLCIGKRDLKDTTSFDGTAECSVLSDELYFGLLQSNEYFTASLDPNCTTTTTRACSNYNFLSEISNNLITLNVPSNNTNKVYSIYYGVLRETEAKVFFNPSLVFYLDSDVIYSSGDGSLESPYKVRI